jgi:protein dithiol:quinone oxidoreductase
MLDRQAAANRRERALLLLLGLVCAGLLGGALYLQYALNEDPCPLCIIQRYAFVTIGLLAFVGSGLSGRVALAAVEVLIVLIALVGAGTAAHHLNIQLHPSASCGFDTLEPLVDSLPLAQWLPSVFKVAGLCETTYPPIFGILLPGWALIAFVLIAACVFAYLVRRKRHSY